jgi:putative ABC transport system substrate-binding protein
MQVAVLVANGPAVPVAKSATSTIPIVFTAGLDPIELGLVRSLNRPGENVTGISVLNVELGPKRVEMIREMLPKARTLGLLVNPSNPNMASVARSTQGATQALGLGLHVEQAGRDADIEPAIEKLRKQGADVLVIGTDPFFTTQQERLAALAVRHALPAIYQYREFAAAGGLMSYGGDLPAAYRRAGVYTARILKGEKAGDLPVEQVTKVELVINLKAARALGLTMSQSLLARADEVIE